MQKPDSANIPLDPGVYLFKDARGRIIYVGKARILRKRVLSYFRADGLPAKTRAMLAHAVSLDFLTTTTEKEALLLEASLIKKHRPHYNIVLRDDKQYVLFRINPKHAYPRLEVVRNARRDGARYFGPFTSALAARETWKLIHRAFALRRCTDRAMKNRVRPCLYHFMGQCPAPCLNMVTPAVYHEAVQKVCDVLQGKAEFLLRGLREDMYKASEDLEFEKAAELRDKISAVEQTVERQAAVLPGGGDMDAVGIFQADKGLALGIVFVRNGAVSDGRAFYWSGLGFEDAPELLWSFTSQYYTQMTPPPRVLLPWLPEAPIVDAADDAAAAADNADNADITDNTDTVDSGSAVAVANDVQPATYEAPTSERVLLEQTLSERRGGLVRIVAPQNARDNQLVDMALTNAREEARRQSSASGPNMATRLAAALHAAEPLRRIECVDVSHTSGMQTRVGLVVFDDGQPDRASYRSYAVDAGGDDYAALYIWTARRLESGPPWPDLLLIDGGRGQISSVRRALDEAGQLGLFALAGIAKARDDQGRADRRAGNTADRIFLPERSNPLSLREGSPELLFLQNIRDTAHRFAISRHRRARAGAALAGELMRLPGIGPATARLLWDTFGGIEAMRAATIEELQALPGIGAARALSLFEKLKKLR